MIRELMELEFKKYKYLGNGVISYNKKGKETIVQFNDVYNTLINYGIDKSSDKVKETLNKMHKAKK